MDSTNTPLKRSKVYLVGAGPGDPGLLTLKAKAILEQADVVIYDYLANPKLLHYAANAEKIDAGKRHRHHTIPQPQINELLIKKALENKVVVRLKGGDPLLFGRGGEELSTIVEAGIPFEIVPGISSALGVPAYVGVPLTHRDYSSNVVFLTGTEHPDKPQTMIPWEAVAQIGTIVVLMGLSVFRQITQRLIAAGRNRETPVVVVQWGTWPQQRSIKGTLTTIAEQVENSNFQPPVLIIIGEVAQFYETFNWSEQKPLYGQRVLVTRTETGASSLSDSLYHLGAEVVPCPTIAIVPPSSWETFDQAVQQAAQMDWVIFTSVNGIDHCMQRLQALGRDARVFGSVRIACVGASTARHLETYALSADVIPQKFQSEGLVEALAVYDLSEKHVWLPQAEVTRGVLSQDLSALGAHVHSTPVYRNVLPSVDMALIVEQLENRQLDWITFTSSSTVKNFFTLLPEAGKAALRAHPPQIACIGPITAETAQQHGLSVAQIPEQQDIEGLVSTLLQTATHSK